MLNAYKIKVYGRVQRIGYRRYIIDIAQDLGLSGYIENHKDGSVDIFVQGVSDKLKEFIEEARNPPKPVRIKEFNIMETSLNPEYKYFEIKPGELWEEFHEGFGGMQSIFMEYWNEFRDYRNEFRDYRSEFREFAKKTDESFNTIMDKYGEISEKLTTILNTLIEESKKTSRMLENIQRDSRETREILLENIRLLREAVEKISKK